MADFQVNGMVSFAATFDDLKCLRCLNARFQNVQVLSNIPLFFKLTHMGDEIFYKLSDGIKVLDMFKSAPKTEENVTSDVEFVNSFVGKSPFSTFMITLNNTETFGAAGENYEDEIEHFFDDRKNIKYLIFNFTISYFDSVFPDQNTIC